MLAPQTPFCVVLHSRSLGFQTFRTQGPLLLAFLQAEELGRTEGNFLFIFEKEEESVTEGKDSSSPP